MKVRCPQCKKEFEQEYENHCSRCGLDLKQWNQGMQDCKACKIPIVQHTLKGMTQCLFELAIKDGSESQ